MHGTSYDLRSAIAANTRDILNNAHHIMICGVGLPTYLKSRVEARLAVRRCSLLGAGFVPVELSLNNARVRI